MKKLLPVFAVLILAACAGSDKKETQTTQSWAGNMQGTAQSFQELLPWLYNGDKFADPKNTEIIRSKISQFQKNIHSIDPKAAEKMLGDDPYVLASLRSLKELTDRAQQSFDRGDRKNSRILLKATTNTCFKCHTRQDLGPKHMHWKNFEVSSIQTNAVEKAHILVSMRQYEEAKIQLRHFISESEQEGKFGIPYENALHYYLMISIRGQQTFQSAINFLKAKALIVKTPTEFHFTIKHWLKDLEYWNKNKAKLKPTLAVAEDVLKRNKETYSERNLINDLVASTLLHNILATEKSAFNKARAYRMLGEAYDELIVEGFWDLPEVYYEKCIDYAPNSKLAQSCYRNLKNNIVVGYSGSRGTAIPNQEYERLEVLRKKAGL